MHPRPRPILPRLLSAAPLLLLLVACGTSGETLTDEGYRPVFHFTPASGWMNDPNGMVCHDGEFHLFYQFYPDSNVWGPMHWGHAVSEDLVDWEQLPVALTPDSLGYIFSGSAVVDQGNTSGFGAATDPALVAIYTQHDPEGEAAGRNDFEYQSISYSTDNGRNWTTYPGNPVVPNSDRIRDFRDPKVIRDSAHGQWLMVFASQDRVRFYASPDLKDWTYLSDFGADAANHDGVWECPDFFPLAVDGGRDTAWVLVQSINPGGANGGSGTFYFTGDWDGARFVPRAEPAYPYTDSVKWLDYGRDNYAGVTWSDVPASDGRRLFLGWMSNWDYAQQVPTTTWRSAMTVPRRLNLEDGPHGLRLRQTPVRELEQLRRPAEPVADGGIPADGVFEMEISLRDAPFELVFDNQANEELRIGYRDGHYYIDRSDAGGAGFSDAFPTGPDTAPRLSDAPTIDLHLYFDRSSVELFADDGRTVMTELLFPSRPLVGYHLNGGEPVTDRVNIWPLKAADN